MFSRIRRFLSQFWNRSRTIDNQPLNQVSLIVIILIDIFILSQVFFGLDDISRWHLSPAEAYPCYSEWRDYQEPKAGQKDFDTNFEILRRSLRLNNNINNYSPYFPELEPQNLAEKNQAGRLGKVSRICSRYVANRDKINNPNNVQIVKKIDQKQTRINSLENTNQIIRSQYDSSLLERIAGQKTERSLNLVEAEKAKQELDKNNSAILTLKQEITNFKTQLITKPESAVFLSLLKDNNKFTTVEQGYKKAKFWYPTIQLALQSLFLIPLIIIALSIYKFAQNRGYGLVSLITWHLLVIFFIPLIFKIFEFLQIKAIFEFLLKIINAILGNLLFLISYVYILLIPLIGFGIIKFFQKIIFNTKIQAANRVQKHRCIRCAKKIHPNDSHCPHCGYYQYKECPSCHAMTYKYLPYCKECGYPQGVEG